VKASERRRGQARAHAKPCHRENEASRPIRVGRGKRQGDHPTERSPHDYRVVDFQGVAESREVVRPCRQRPPIRVPTIASPAAPGIDVDELGNLGERFEGGLEDGHLLAGASRDEQHNRPLPHARAFRDEPGARHVEEQTHVIDLNSHSRSDEHRTATTPAVLRA
jgi:hypothetical protein